MPVDLPASSIAQVLLATDESDLLVRLGTVARNLGFEHFLVGVEIKHPKSPPIQHVSSGYPPKWRQTYIDSGYLFVDPTVARCQTSTSPFIWSESLYTDDSRPLWEDARGHGLVHGLSVPVHESVGVKSMLSLARDRPFNSSETEQKLTLECAHVIASVAHVAATKILLPKITHADTTALTRRERDCLGWAAAGKTSWEIAEILRISEHTAIFHLGNVMRKLGVSNRNQAVAKGLSLGLVS